MAPDVLEQMVPFWPAPVLPGECRTCGFPAFRSAHSVWCRERRLADPKDAA